MLGDSTCGQRAVYEVGLTGVPIYNVSTLICVHDKEKQVCYNIFVLLMFFDYKY